MADNWEKVGTGKTWDYAKDKTIEGVFVLREENVGPNGSNMYTLELKNGERVGVWGNAVLDTRFKNLVLGEEVKVEYLGMAESEKVKGRKYHSFDVFHRILPMEKVENSVDIEDVSI